jgi:hypothetical protein
MGLSWVVLPHSCRDDSSRFPDSPESPPQISEFEVAAERLALCAKAGELELEICESMAGNHPADLRW